MKQGWKQAGLILAGAGALGLVLAFGGLLPIRASSGHWPITSWFLHTVMRRTVATHSAGLPERPLADPGLIVQGAGHFETGCKPCHGAPGERQPKVVQQMTPPPPYLPDEVGDWEVDDLFYIVKHGVKFTGMPAWPALERDDEVWAVVAFVDQLPGMTPEEYQDLVRGNLPSARGGWAGADGVSARDGWAGADAAGGGTAELDTPGDRAPPFDVLETCGRCHGVEGEGRGYGVFPRLAGQSPEYLYRALVAYADGSRHSGIMEPVAADLEPRAMQELAQYYGSLRSGAAPAPAGRAGSGSASARRPAAVPTGDGDREGARDGARGRPGTGDLYSARPSGADPGSRIDPGAGSGSGEGGGHSGKPPDPIDLEGLLAALPDLEEAVRRGEQIALHGIPERKIPSCVDCHGPGADHPRNPVYPRLAGQYADYLALQLWLFKQGHRGGSAYAHLMEPVTARMTDREMKDLALYYASVN